MPNGIYTKINCNVGKHSKFTPQTHQNEVLEYFLNKSVYKGLLFYHRLGSGKSCSSIIISDKMLEQSKAKKIFVLTPGSLRQNYIEEYCEKCGKSPEFLKKYYTFITTNYNVGKFLPNFDNSLIIIDEIHNLINGVKNRSTNAMIIYEKLLNSNCRILALSGTPIYNNYWEWPLIGNLLKPGTFPNLFKDSILDTHTYEKQFNISKEGYISPKNLKMFLVDLRGIISYFPGVGGNFYPKVIHKNPIKIQMTIPQHKEYFRIAQWEGQKRRLGPPKLSDTNYGKKHKEFLMASKFIMSRSTSNFYYPTEYRNADDISSRDTIEHMEILKKFIYEPTGIKNIDKQTLINTIYLSLKNESKEQNTFEGDKIPKICSKDKQTKLYKKVEKNIKEIKEDTSVGWVNNKNFENRKLVDIYSRKIAAVIINIITNWNSKHVLFSFFKNKSGVNIIHSLLTMCGIKAEIYSGDISNNKRQSILNKFNTEKNRYGEIIKILLVTEAGAEGINILEAQHMHILESSTRENKIQQVIGRVVRYKSHMVDGRKPMSKNEQVVNIWRYWSVADPTINELSYNYINKEGMSKTVTLNLSSTITVDEILYDRGRISMNITQSFLSLLKKASITSYDKKYDSDNFLKDYSTITISPDLINGYIASDNRYIKNNKQYKDSDEIDDLENIEDAVNDFNINDENSLIENIENIEQNKKEEKKILQQNTYTIQGKKYDKYIINQFKNHTYIDNKILKQIFKHKLDIKEPLNAIEIDTLKYMQKKYKNIIPDYSNNWINKYIKDDQDDQDDQDKQDDQDDQDNQDKQDDQDKQLD